MGMATFATAAASALAAITMWDQARQQEQQAARVQAVTSRMAHPAAVDPLFQSPLFLSSPVVLSHRPARAPASDAPFSRPAANDAFTRTPPNASPSRARGSRPAAARPDPQAATAARDQLALADALRAEAMAQAERQAAAMESRAMAEDADTQAHEAAHQSAGGHLAGGISLGFSTVSMTMPDGTQRTVTYASSGSVPIAMPAVPQALPPGPDSMAKLAQVQSDLTIAESAALAPGAGLSSADSAIAAMAASMAAQASAMLSALSAKPPVRDRAPQSPMSPDFAQAAPASLTAHKRDWSSVPRQTRRHSRPAQSSRLASGPGAMAGEPGGARAGGVATRRPEPNARWLHAPAGAAALA